MAYRIITQSRAERDIEDAFLTIAGEAPEAAVRWYRRLKAEIETLSEMPSRCGYAPESEKLGVEIRQLLFGRLSGTYRIVFQIGEDAKIVHVLTVRHGARKPLELDDFE